MSNELSQTSTAVLAALRAIVARIRAVPDPERGPGFYAEWRAVCQLRRTVADGIDNRDVVTQWLGHMPTLAERRAFHRAIDQLEGAGLIERVFPSMGERSTRVKLVEAQQ